MLPVSALYGGAVAVRNFSYDRGLLKVRKLPALVVSVGNISVGGSGKTPFAMYLADKLLLLGKRPAVLSRGYKRLTDELVVACPEKGYQADAETMGDEPMLISHRLPQIPVAVHADRYRAGMAVLERFGADVFILDDGLQYRELHRDLDFVLMNHALSDLNDTYLPTGNLRDSKRRLMQADVVVLTAHTSFAAGADRTSILARYTGAPVSGISFVASDLSDHAGVRVAVETLRDKEVVGFCGIANAGPFHETLNDIAGKTVPLKGFRDHHWYDEYDIDEVFEGNDERIAVTTAKDAARIFGNEEFAEMDEMRRIYSLNEKAVVNFGAEHIDKALSEVFGNVYA